MRTCLCVSRGDAHELLHEYKISYTLLYIYIYIYILPLDKPSVSGVPKTKDLYLPREVQWLLYQTKGLTLIQCTFCRQ